MSNNLPKHIAVCGMPKSGKTAIAGILSSHFNYLPIDDGLILRRAAPIIFGFNDEYPYSQFGKSQSVDTPAGEQEVRKILGDLGNLLESHYGESMMPWAAMREAQKFVDKHLGARFVYPSCRKTQGKYYKEAGGLVIEVIRPGIEPSVYEFDQYDPTYIDHTIHNDGTLQDLEKSVAAFINNL